MQASSTSFRLRSNQHVETKWSFELIPLKTLITLRIRLLAPHDESAPTCALNIACSRERNHTSTAATDSPDRVALPMPMRTILAWVQCLKALIASFASWTCSSTSRPPCCPCYAPTRAGVTESIRQGGRPFAAATQSGRDSLTVCESGSPRR